MTIAWNKEMVLLGRHSIIRQLPLSYNRVCLFDLEINDITNSTGTYKIITTVFINKDGYIFRKPFKIINIKDYRHHYYAMKQLRIKKHKIKLIQEYATND